jgi:hypothetical protein
MPLVNGDRLWNPVVFASVHPVTPAAVQAAATVVSSAGTIGPGRGKR